MSRIRWGILGTGFIAREFARGLRLVPEAHLLAVGSRTHERAAAFAALHGVPRTYGSYEALAEDPDIDVVYIATPNSQHKDNCVLCLNSSKAVLCEKPFTVTAADARDVIALARRKRLFCMEAMWTRFVPLIRELPRIIGNSAIGDLRMATMQLGFPNALDPSHRLFNAELGGGALLDLGVYPLSLAFQLFGKPTHIDSQAVFGTTGVDEQVSILLGYPEGRQAVLTASLRNQTSNDAVIMGADGYAHIHAPLYCPHKLSLVRTPRRGATSASHPGLRQLYSRIGGYLPLPQPRRVKTMTWHYKNGYCHEASEVVRCLTRGAIESTIMPLDETLSIMETIDCIRQRWSAVATYA